MFWFINITVNLTNRSYNNPVNLSYDKYAGGRYELFRGIDPIDFFDDNGNLTQFQADLLNALIGSANINFNVEQTFGFIPTPSALDVGGGATTLDDDDYFRVYNAANPPTGNLAIPFQNFITAYENNNSENEEHISFNFRNGNWLATELDTTPNNEDIFDCSAFCVEALVIGEDILCTTGTYSVTDQATVATWTVIDPNNLVSFTTSGTDIVLYQLNPDQFGTVTLEVTYGSPRCGFATATKDIEVGILPYHLDSATITGETSVCDSQQYTYYISGLNHPCVNDIEWTVSDNLNIISHTANSVTVTSDIFDDEYAGLITANLPNSSFTIEKGVWVGVPNQNNLHIQKIGIYDLNTDRWTKLKASYQTMLYPANGPLNLTFEWQIPNSWVRNYTDTAYKDVKPYNAGQINIGVRAICECGNSGWKYRQFNVEGTTNTFTELIPAGGN